MAFDPNNPTGSGMVLTFDDEFSSVSWSADVAATHSKWNDHGSNPGLALESASDSALSLSNGALTMTATNDGSGWKSGFFQSVNTSGQGWTQKYGYYEADIKMPAGQNAWPGFWLYHTSGPASEIDIVETGGTAHETTWAGTVHDGFGAQNGNNVQNAGVDLSAAYHRYGMLWDPNSSNITWYLDGKQVMTAPKYSDTDQSPMTMILNLAVADAGGGNTPLAMSVDYVRVYQFASQNPTAVQADAASPAPGNSDPVALVDALGHTSGGAGST
ncbi:MAG TPA: glycoside hydrolase family 16 protein, partial [Stellaceae bacterium]